MLFHIQATHTYETCLANDPEKKKILRDALKSAEQKGVKIHNLVSSRPAHTLWMIVEAETFEAIDEMFELDLKITTSFFSMRAQNSYPASGTSSES